MREVVDDSRAAHRESGIPPDNQGIRRGTDFPFQRATIRDLAPQFGKEEEKKPIEETAEGTDGLPSMNLTGSNPIIEGTGTAETETAATTESEVESTVENAVVDAGNTPVLEDGNTLSGSQKWKHPQE